MIAHIRLGDKKPQSENVEYTTEELTMPGEELETLAMSASWNGNSYDMAAYMNLREHYTIEQLCRAIMIRKSLEYVSQ